jgi:hypothetical protein
MRCQSSFGIECVCVNCRSNEEIFEPCIVNLSDILAGAIENTYINPTSFADYDSGLDLFDCYADGENYIYKDPSYTKNEAIKIMDQIIIDAREGRLTLDDEGVIVNERGDWMCAEDLLDMYS